MEVAASVVGLLAVGTQVAVILQQFISSSVNAPELAQFLKHEIQDFRFVLLKLQPIVLGSVPLNRSRASLIDIDHLSFTLTGCVCTFSILEKEVDRIKSNGKMDFWDRIKWARTEATFAQLLLRLQSHKLSLTLILTVLTCESPYEAATSQQTLSQHLATGIPSTSQMSAVGQTPSASGIRSTNHDQYSISYGSNSVTDDTSSLANFDTNSIRTVSSASTAKKGLYRLGFESTLFVSRPYIRASKASQSAMSLDTFDRPKPRWSLYTGRSSDSVLSLPTSLQEISGVTLAEAPSLSSISLPIAVESLHNRERYSIDAAHQRVPTALPSTNRVISSGQSPLHLACQKGETEQARRLLFECADPNAKDRFGDRPLHKAVHSDFKEIVLLLLDWGADKDATDSINRTPLAVAASAGSEGMVLLLLDHGADMETMDDNERTPLDLALGGGHQAVLKILMERGTDWNSSVSKGRAPLAVAMSEGREPLVLRPLDRGAAMEAMDHNNDTLFHVALRNRNQAIAQLLLKRSADMNARDSMGRTPLAVAVSKGWEPVVLHLLDRGADMEAMDHNKDTPIHVALRNGHQAIAQLLLKKGADMNARDSMGRTLLAVAVSKGLEPVVLDLLDRGADMEAMDHQTNTPLHLASRHGYRAIVQLLLDRGAEKEARDIDGQTALLSAVRDGRQAIVGLLLNRGAATNIRDKEDKTPLVVAIDKGHEGIVILLLKRGADTATMDTEGYSPLHTAASKQYPAIVRHLLHMGADKDARNKAGETPLDIAVRLYDIGAAKILREWSKAVGDTTDTATELGLNPGSPSRSLP